MTGTTNHNTPAKPRKIRRGTKLFNVVRRLADGQRLDRFTAEWVCHDHTLPSTISCLVSRYGLRVLRREIIVPGHAGSRVRCAEYWLDAEARQHAQELLKTIGSTRTRTA